MNTNESTQNNISKNPVVGANAFNQSDAKAQLKKIGDQIEAIAKKWEGQKTSIDTQGLYDLGNKVEHFLDKMNDASFSTQSSTSFSDKKSPDASYTAGSSGSAVNPSLDKNAADQKDRLS